MTTTTEKPYDVAGNILAYETDQLGGDKLVELFQHLLDSGLCWKLQGQYARTANRFIEVGLITQKETTNANHLPSQT